MEKTIWIIRFEDGRIRSFYGMRQDAEEVAKSIQKESGSEYKIL